MTEPQDEPVYRVRMGIGLLRDVPMSDAQRAQQQREDEREAAQAEAEAEQRREAAFERRWELERRGVQARSVSEILQAASFAQDRNDRREARIEREAEAAGLLPEPRLNRYEMRIGQQAREEARQTAPATQADVKRLEQELTKVKSGLHSATGWRP
jgi:hypothetical protein